MDKEALTSVGVIFLLLVVVIVATVINNRQQLVATRPQVNAVMSEALGSMLGIEKEAEQVSQIQQGSTACPVGCSLKPTPEPAAGQKEQLQADPVPFVRDALTSKMATSLQEGALETVYSLDTQTWWRSDEGYRIQMTAGKTLTAQTPTTAKAYELAPATANEEKNKGVEIHPALRHPILTVAEQEMRAAMKKLDFKEVKLSQCPVDDAYDPFDNCLAAYVHKKSAQKCLLLARYGKYGEVADPTHPFLRIELTCSDNYDHDYALAAPYLYAIRMIDPDWLIPDTAVYGVTREADDRVLVNYGYRQARFQEIDRGLRLISETPGAASCEVTSDENGQLSTECN